MFAIGISIGWLGVAGPGMGRCASMVREMAGANVGLKRDGGFRRGGVAPCSDERQAEGRLLLRVRHEWAVGARRSVARGRRSAVVAITRCPREAVDEAHPR